MLERHQWALVKEREKLRAEIEKESVLAQERFRETLREQMRSEIEYERGRVREMSSRLKAELEQSRDVESALLARRDQFEGVLKSLDQDARDLEAALYDGLEELALDPECSETIKVRLHGITSELEAKLKRYSQRIQRALN